MSQVESYNPTSNQWVSRPSLNQKKGSLAGASLCGKIFVVGGGNGLACYSEVEMLDMNIGKWITTQSMLQKVLCTYCLKLLMRQEGCLDAYRINILQIS